ATGRCVGEPAAKPGGVIALAVDAMSGAHHIGAKVGALDEEAIGRRTDKLAAVLSGATAIDAGLVTNSGGVDIFAPHPAPAGARAFDAVAADACPSHADTAATFPPQAVGARPGVRLPDHAVAVTGRGAT